MKKIISALLIFVFLFAMIPTVVLAIPHYEDWEKNVKYLYFLGNNGSRQTGYTLDIIIVTLTDEFAAENKSLTPVDFGEASSKIMNVKMQPDRKTCYLYLYEDEYDKSLSGSPIWTEEQVQSVIDCVRQVRALEFVKEAYPNQSSYRAPVEREPAEWEDRENYYHYNDDGTKKGGYILDCIMVRFYEDFVNMRKDFESDELDPSYFGSIASSIKSIVFYPDFKSCAIHLFEDEYQKDDAGNPIYTDEQIDRVIELTRKVEEYYFVKSASPNSAFTAGFEPIPSTPIVDTGSDTAAPTENNAEEKSPKTGYDPTFTAPAVVLLVISVAAIVYVAVFKRKKCSDR